jgi:hypothetical protein
MHCSRLWSPDHNGNKNHTSSNSVNAYACRESRTQEGKIA